MSKSFTACLYDTRNGDITSFNVDGRWNENSFFWTGGNYGCDCNRRILFGESIDQVDCSEGLIRLLIKEDGKILYNEIGAIGMRPGESVEDLFREIDSALDGPDIRKEHAALLRALQPIRRMGARFSDPEIELARALLDEIENRERDHAVQEKVIQESQALILEPAGEEDNGQEGR